MKNQRFDLPWHAATLIKEWVQYIVPLQFYILLYGLDLPCPWFFSIDLYTTLVAPAEDENYSFRNESLPLEKGVRGFEFLETNRIPLNLPLSKG